MRSSALVVLIAASSSVFVAAASRMISVDVLLVGEFDLRGSDFSDDGLGCRAAEAGRLDALDGGKSVEVCSWGTRYHRPGEPSPQVLASRRRGFDQPYSIR